MLLPDGGEAVAGGAGAPLRWDGEAGTAPGGYDGAMAAEVTGHEASVVPDTLRVMVAAGVRTASAADRPAGRSPRRATEPWNPGRV